jgi:hypothetical protein
MATKKEVDAYYLERVARLAFVQLDAIARARMAKLTADMMNDPRCDAPRLGGEIQALAGAMSCHAMLQRDLEGRNDPRCYANQVSTGDLTNDMMWVQGLLEKK